jgi:signal transduction histidine kinase
MILDNLITNAIKYSSADNEITVSVSPDLQNGVMIISVKDKGFGIPQMRFQICSRNSTESRAKLRVALEGRDWGSIL